VNIVKLSNCDRGTELFYFILLENVREKFNLARDSVREQCISFHIPVIEYR
jgi:hypothetical protein